MLSIKLPIKKDYRKIAEQIELFSRGFSGWEDNPIMGIGKKCDLNELVKIMEKRISEAGLQILPNEKKAKLVCIAFTQYPDHEGYDVCGCVCFDAKSKEYTIKYCGVCGDVNFVNVIAGNHYILYVR